jgi:hypothetical protein
VFVIVTPCSTRKIDVLWANRRPPVVSLYLSLWRQAVINSFGTRTNDGIGRTETETAWHFKSSGALFPFNSVGVRLCPRPKSVDVDHGGDFSIGQSNS